MALVVGPRSFLSLLSSFIAAMLIRAPYQGLLRLLFPQDVLWCRIQNTHSPPPLPSDASFVTRHTQTAALGRDFAVLVEGARIRSLGFRLQVSSGYTEGSLGLRMSVFPFALPVCLIAHPARVSISVCIH